MCGIVGFWARNGGAADAHRQRAQHMARQLIHRGPDDAGAWVDPHSGMALAHQRLAVVDLSQSGEQPMHSASGRWVIVFNGEIYDHSSHRQKLQHEGVTFRGTSDTEVLLALVERCGVAEAIRCCAGMFAFGLWDRREKTLWLGRDRLGEKPLYYGQLSDGTFAFASELRALRAHPAFAGGVDPEAQWLFFRYGYVPGTACIHPGLHKLAPGHLLELPANASTPTTAAFWDLTSVAREGEANPLPGSLDDVADVLEASLRTAVAGQLVADVPLGAFLSGGIDSSAIVALAQEQSNVPVRTFTVGFDEAAFDEAPYAQAVAQHLGTDHTELRVRAADALELVPELPRIWDEPMADSSQIPSALIARLTREHVTVALSADGGDELFAGYNTYRWVERAWDGLRWLPQGARALTGQALDWALRYSPNLPLKHRAHRVAQLFDAPSSMSLFEQLSIHWSTPPLQQRVQVTPSTPASFRSLRTSMQVSDARRYLPDDVLVKVDRAAMAASLETRAPLLDHRFVALAFRVPPAMRDAHGLTKAPLRRILYRRVPPALVERPKKGFAVPLAQWLRGPLRDWAESLLSPSLLQQSGLREDLILPRWVEHLRGERDWKYPLWDVLTYQAWKAEHLT